MGQIELTQPILASPRHVFAFFVPQRMPYWYGPEMESCFEVLGGASDFAVGQKVRISGILAGRSVSHTAVITACTDGELLEWRFQDEYGFRGVERWELASAPASPESPERTVVRFIARYQVSGRLARLLDRLLTRRAVSRRHSDYLRRLASLVERRKQTAYAGGAGR